MPLLPEELRVDPVLAALLHCVAFLELSDDDTVDPDWAVEAMEYVATYVQRLGQNERRRIGADLARVAMHAREHGAPDAFTSFADRFLVSCGLDRDA